MTPRRAREVKAWAVVDCDGVIHTPQISLDVARLCCANANDARLKTLDEGRPYRVVPVTITFDRPRAPRAESERKGKR